jgi:two-component system, NtrC family, sensor kinase
MSLPLLPIWIVDLLGSGLMILFSFLCVHLARRLRDQDPNNIVWTYLLWLSYSLAAFAISRSVGHILKRVLLTTGYSEFWDTIKPYSGAVNTLMFVVVASITLFFQRILRAYQQISKDRQVLQDTHEKLLFMNRNLERLVEERTYALTLSERKYRRIFEISRDMIAVVSDDGTIVGMNPAGLKMLGLQDSWTLEGRKNFKDFFPCTAEWDALQEVLCTQGYVSDAEIQLKCQDGTSFSILMSAAAEMRSSGEIDTLHFLMKDISQRKAMEKQLLQADKLASIGQLAAGIAHEVNNPLSVILGYTQLLLRTEDQASQKYEDLKIIEKHARTCKTIVGDLLSFARGTRTKKDVAHLHATIEEILSVVHNHFELDGVEIIREFDDRVPTMIMDAEKIKQVLMNLLMNAKQAIGKKGTIRLSTHYNAARCSTIIQVMDTGCGIESEYLNRIFDPFFTTKSTGEGTGLGLSVSYGIVKDHGGEILVESDPGRGSTFTVILPVILERPVAV